MCGISGIINNNESIETVRQKAQLMTSRLAHRGPDEENIWLDETVGLALGHRRLAIQDLSPNGSQPMQSHSGRWVIAFNGEIYNFKSLAKELAVQGVSFRGHSDTEVLLAAIENWGLDQTLTKIKGMFAFALWNKTTQTLYLARDRIGEKPLYYGWVDGQFVFASELKSFFAIANKNQFELDFNALGSYFRYGYISAPFSIFKSIKKLKPGHSLAIPLAPNQTPNELNQSSIDSLEQTSYWTLPEVYAQRSNQIINDETQAITQLDTLLNRVVREQAISDVPLGAFLSGGIDSSVVSAILQANSDSPIDTFTVGFHEKSFNEALHAKSVAEHIGSHHHEVYVSPTDALNTIPALNDIYDEPFADSSQIPTLLVSQLAKKAVTVCLSGDGGDELFTGYNRYTVTENAFQRAQRLPAPLRKIVSTVLSAVSPARWDYFYGAVTAIFKNANAANVGLKLHKLASLLKIHSLDEVYRYLSGYWHNPQLLLRPTIDEPILSNHLSFDNDFIAAAMMWDQNWYLPGDNLVKTDRASMSVSLEMRLPLLDKDIIEYSWQIPTALKFKNNQSKWLLRQVLYQYVPAKLIDRPKMGFSVPVAHWIRHELRDWSESLINDDWVNQQDIFNLAEIKKVFNEHMSGRYDHSHKLWTLLMFQSWHRHYLGK